MDVESFSDEELRERLRGYNQDVPPITDTTRKILKKRLMKLMGVVASPPGKYVPKSAVPEPARTDSPLRRTRQTPVVDLRRTPSPPIAPLLRPIQPSSSASPRKILRSGAAFSSDESDSETVGSFSQQTRLRPNATAGSPIRGNLSGRLLGSLSSSVTATDSSDSSTTRLTSSFGRWFGAPSTAPKTSTPTEKYFHNLQDSFGIVTPIKEDGIRRRPLGRPPLEAFDRPDSRLQKPGFFDRFRADPIHLTPQQTEQRHIRHSPPRPRPLQFLGSSRSEDGGWTSRYISWIILIAAIIFFTTVGLLYARIKWDSSVLDNRIVRYRLEGRSDADTLFQKSEHDAGLVPDRSDGRKFYNEEETLRALNIAAALSKELARMKVSGYKGDVECDDKDKWSMTVTEARAYALQSVEGTSSMDFGNAVDLIVANPHWGIKALDSKRGKAEVPVDVQVFETDFATKGFLCRLKEAVATMLFKVLSVIFLIGLMIGAGFLLRNYMQRRARHQEMVYDMVNKIVSLVQKNYEQSLKDSRVKPHMAVLHIRENFVQHGRQRSQLLSVFNDAVKYISAHESRISLSIQQINGEEFEVWTWLHNQLPIQQPDSTEPDAPSSTSRNPGDSSIIHGNTSVSNARARLWSGGANMRTVLPEQLVAVTSCLKMRGMFNGLTENQNDRSWTLDIEDAIKEKCHGVAQILDMVVEPQSEEGIVYMKLASNEDARNAYLAMHGQYFDGTLVNVKFLKLDRYHMRFPNSVDKRQPLPRAK